MEPRPFTGTGKTRRIGASLNRVGEPGLSVLFIHISLKAILTHNWSTRVLRSAVRSKGVDKMLGVSSK